jgi:hypothetical protein
MCGWQQKCGCKAVAAFSRESPVVASATGAAAAAGAAGAAEAGSHTNLN